MSLIGFFRETIIEV